MAHLSRLRDNFDLDCGILQTTVKNVDLLMLLDLLYLCTTGFEYKKHQSIFSSKIVILTSSGCL